MTILASWPFAQYGIDIVGLLPMAIWQRKFVIMVVEYNEYFTKWTEAAIIAMITQLRVEKFV